MPPFGLYQMPRHHLSGQLRAPRPSCNSMDFVEKEVDPEKVDEGGGEVEASAEKEKKQKEKRDKKERKAEKKRRKLLEAQDMLDAGEEKEAATTPAAVSSKDKKKKKKSLDAQSALEITDSNEAATTPATERAKEKKSKDKKEKEKGTDDTKSSTKKRKRESDTEVHAATLSHVQFNTNPLLHPGSTDTLKTTNGEPSAASDASMQPPAVKKQSKIVIKSRSAPSLIIAAQQPTKPAASSDNTVTAPVGKVPKKRGRPPKPKPDPVAVSTAQPPTAPAPTSQQRIVRKTPVPLPQHASSSRPAKTPVALPQNMQPHPAPRVSVAPQSHVKLQSQLSHILVNETPQSQLEKPTSGITTTPIPFKLTSQPATTRTTLKKPTDTAGVAIPSSSLPISTQDSPSKRRKVSRTLSATRKPIATPRPSVALTSTNLQRYTEPLRDEPKPRPRARSRARSTASSVSSMSIKDAFLRAAKGAEGAPFLTPRLQQTQQKENHTAQHLLTETHAEASAPVFDVIMQSLRACVNFSDEARYHRDVLTWRANDAAKGSPPCLGVLSGCTAKREQLLLLSSTPDPSSSSAADSPLKIVATNPSSQARLQAARKAHTQAEQLLRLSIPARIPIPLGPIAGLWTLHPPSTYTATHIDKHATARCLSIACTASTSPSPSPAETYTAQLSLPPRPLPFALHPFTTPPHASFRSTLLRTVDEGYGVEVLFLGGGYCVLRMDVGLLLTGRSGDGDAGEGKGRVMEFVGVREGCVV